MLRESSGKVLIMRGEDVMIEIRTYVEGDRDEVIKLVLHCQNDGTRPHVTVEDQPELLHIPEKYMGNGGNFWVAEENGRTAGCIGLMNCGDGLGILKKFFVYEAYRSSPHHLGLRLYGKLLESARQMGIRKFILDTPRNTERAHRFYEKAGFVKVEQDQLPITYDCPYEDCDFFCLDIL